MTRAAAAVLLVLMTLAACGGGDDHEHDHAGNETAFTSDAADTTVEVELRDYAFVGVPETVDGPKVFFAAETTQGEHELIVLRGDEELGAVHPPPMGKADLAVELPTGDYALVCRIQEGPENHEELGMRQPFSVR